MPLLATTERFEDQAVVLGNAIVWNAKRGRVEQRQIDQPLELFELLATLIWGPGNGNGFHHIITHRIGHRRDVNDFESVADVALLGLPAMQIQNDIVGSYRGKAEPYGWADASP